MNENQIYNALQRGGAFALPYLLKMEHPQSGALYFVNNTDDVTLNGVTYKASSFEYTAPQTIGGVLKNGQLEITAIDNAVIDLIDTSDELFKVTATGVLNSDGTVTAFKSYRHQYGTATISEEMKIIISFSNDDRMEMSFPPYVFDADNNSGNA